MKIARMDTFHVLPRWLFLKVTTDTGIVGWGEPILEGRAQAVEAAVKEYSRILIGEDPRRIEHLWQVMYRGAFYRGGPVLTGAISGIEQALWDILGKSLNVPVHQLLGGRVRDKIRMYGWLRTEGIKDQTDYVNAIKVAVGDARFTAYKMAPLPAMRFVETPAVYEMVAAQVAAARKVLGDQIDLGLDFHGRASPAAAKKLCRMLEPYSPMFVEEPVLPEDTDALKELARSTTIPIATGEHLFTRWQFQELIERQAVAIVQPDLSHCGGIFEARKIAAMAESKNIGVAPHCPLGPITLASSLQLAACTPNFVCQEHVTLGQDYLKKAFEVVEGHVAVPQGPGLGIEVDEEKVKAGRFDGDWPTPMWSTADGAFAEW